MQFTSTHKEEVMFKSTATSLYVKAVTVTASLAAIALTELTKHRK